MIRDAIFNGHTGYIQFFLIIIIIIFAAYSPPETFTCICVCMFFYFFISPSLRLRSAAAGCVVTTSTLFIYSVFLSHIPSQWAQASGCQPGTSRPAQQSKATVNPRRLEKPCRASRGPGWEMETRWQVRWKMKFSRRGGGEGGGRKGDTFFIFLLWKEEKSDGPNCVFSIRRAGGKKVTVSGGFSVWPQKWTMRSDEFVFLAFFHFII